MAVNECYSCGNEASDNSPRNFCNACDSVFEEGLTRQAAVIERAEKLDVAKEAGDSDAVGRIMTEIFKESVVPVQETASVPVSNATTEQVDN